MQPEQFCHGLPDLSSLRKHKIHLEARTFEHMHTKTFPTNLLVERVVLRGTAENRPEDLELAAATV